MIEVDVDHSKIKVGNETHKVFPKMCEVLDYLMQTPGEKRSYNDIMYDIWGYCDDDVRANLQVVISYLRGVVGSSIITHTKQMGNEGGYAYVEVSDDQIASERWGLRNRYSGLRRSLALRDMELNLDYSVFCELIEQGCGYCGSESYTLSYTEDSPALDRSNAIPVCKICRDIRKGLSHDGFVRLGQVIAYRWGTW